MRGLESMSGLGCRGVVLVSVPFELNIEHAMVSPSMASVLPEFESLYANSVITYPVGHFRTADIGLPL